MKSNLEDTLDSEYLTVKTYHQIAQNDQIGLRGYSTLQQ